MKKAGLCPIHIFCNVLDSLFNFVYVNKKFCFKNLFRLVQYCVGKFSHILYYLHKMYKGRCIEFIEFRVFRKRKKIDP